MMKCGDCGTEVSDAAAACPRCGRPTISTVARQNNLKVFAVIGLLLIGVLLVWVFVIQPAQPH